MVVDDLVVCGAEPLFMTDYVVCGRVEPERVAADRDGHRGRLRAGGLRADRRRDGGAPRPLRRRTTSTSPARPPASWTRTGCSAPTASASGTSSSRWPAPACTPTAFPWSGRSSMRPALAWISTASRPGSSQSLGAELLTPTRIYARDCLALADACAVRTFAHVTGGGLAANLARVLPPAGRRGPRPRDLAAAPGIRAARRARRRRGAEMERTFNMGVGMVAVVGPAGRRSGARPAGRARCAGLGDRPDHCRAPAPRA